MDCRNYSRTPLRFSHAPLLCFAVALLLGTSEAGHRERPSATRIDFHKEAVEEVSTDHINLYLRNFTKVPHFPGSVAQRELAEYIKREWKKFGMDPVEIKKYDVLLSFPTKPGSVTVVLGNGSVEFVSAPVEAPLIPQENVSGVPPPFNAYSPSGTVKGKLVYANYGRPEDFETLKEHGISIKNKILLIRYGRVARNSKPRLASSGGAIGVIFFWDPKDCAKMGPDKVYPEYNWLPKTGVQRGTILDAYIKGDPLTPGYPSVEGMYRIPLEDAKLPTIPVHPISYQDAEALLRMLHGSPPGKGWGGGLNASYGVEMAEDDEREVILNVNTKLEVTEIFNVIGVIQGREEPDRLVMLGNHRDAWVFGGADPSSGSAAMLEVARVLGQQREKGWQPRRSIVFCSWAAEEQLYMGSVEFLEEFSRLLSDRAVAYLNVDAAVDGNYVFRAKSMPLLDWALAEATKKVPSPRDDGESTFDEWIRKKPSKPEQGLPRLPRLKVIGGYSDHAMFYQRLGVPCVDIRYTGKTDADAPLHHTLHDNYWWMTSLVDPDLKFHQVTTRVWTQLTMSLADSVILPFNVTHYGFMLTYFANDLKHGRYGAELKRHNVKLAPLYDAICAFKDAATKLGEIIQTSSNNERLIQRINERLMRVERAFISEMGIIPKKTLMRQSRESLVKRVMVTPS